MESPAGNAARQLGKALDEEREFRKDSISYLKSMVASVIREQATERQINEDRHEALNRKLDRILELLNKQQSNGHG